MSDAYCGVPYGPAVVPQDLVVPEAEGEEGLERNAHQCLPAGQHLRLLVAERSGVRVIVLHSIILMY
jgi:hypothetical protein